MSRVNSSTKLILPLISALVLVAVGVVVISGNLGSPNTALLTSTPTKTPRPSVTVQAAVPPTPLLEIVTRAPTAAPTATLAPTATPAPTETVEPPHTPIPPTATQQPPTVQPALAQPTAPPPPTDPPAPAVDFVITELRVLGLAENNGGIESGGAHNIYVTVLDAGGNPLDGAVISNEAGATPSSISGDKGPGKAEVLMWQEDFRLKVESLGGAPVTSEVSHNMSLISPVAGDIVGKLGDACTALENCSIPPYKHFSYAITFRRTH